LQNSVSRIGKPLGVVPGLRAVLSLRKACELAPIRAQLRNPIEHRYGNHGASTAGLRRRDEGVAPLARYTARISDTFEIPILSAVIGVELPVIAAAVVAAITVQWHVKVVELGGCAVCDSVNPGVDGVPPCIYVD